MKTMECISVKSNIFIYVWMTVLVALIASISGVMTSDVMQNGEWKDDVVSICCIFVQVQSNFITARVSYTVKKNSFSMKF